MISPQPSCEPTPAPDAIWQLSRTTTLTWQHWENESVVFDSQTGDTHLLDLVAREGLLCLGEQALSCRELCQQLAARLATAADDSLLTYTQQLICRLNELGLLEIADR